MPTIKSVKSVLMVASENDGIPNCKVGGIGDVLRDVPPALARHDYKVAVVTPSYGLLHAVAGAEVINGEISCAFGNVPSTAALYRVPGKVPHPGVTHFVIDHPTFSQRIYTNDPPERPFASDATKYARFCLAVAEAIRMGLFPQLDVLHLHDWHSAFLLILRRYHPTYRTPLQGIPTAYTIHNLALQGIRPFQGDAESSLMAWYPGLPMAPDLADPRWPDCVNPMAVGIRFADTVHTVSPSYAEEILRPSAPPDFFGGEGLEADLQQARSTHRLVGILNGCDYPAERAAKLPTHLDFLQHLRASVLGWIATDGVSAAHAIALERLRDLSAAADPPQIILTSVSRVVDQKMLLLRAAGSDGVSGLDHLLRTLGRHGIYVLLGTGDPDYEQFLTAMSARHTNFVFLNGFSNASASALYAQGDLFMMPSSFEPCGISQMLAMRDAQPCLVHAVGGLRDTVIPDVNGFTFEGETLQAQVDALLVTFRRAMEIKTTNGPRWQSIVDQAARARFHWGDTAEHYIAQLYHPTQKRSGPRRTPGQRA